VWSRPRGMWRRTGPSLRGAVSAGVRLEGAPALSTGRALVGKLVSIAYNLFVPDVLAQGSFPRRQRPSQDLPRDVVQQMTLPPGVVPRSRDRDQAHYLGLPILEYNVFGACVAAGCPMCGVDLRGIFLWMLQYRFSVT